MNELPTGITSPAAATIATGASTPPLTEPTIKKEAEVTVGRRVKEIRHVSRMLINRALKRENQSQSESAPDAGSKGLHNVNTILHLRYDSDSSKNQVWTHAGGDPMVIESTEGKKLPISSVERTKEGNYLCVFKNEDGTAGSITLDVDQMTDLAVASETINLVQAFSGDERQLVEHYFHQIDSGESAISAIDSDQMNNLLKKVAESAGMLRAEDIVSSIVEIPIPSNATPEMIDRIKKINESLPSQREKVQKLLEGTNLITSEDTSLLADLTGLTPAGLKEAGVNPKALVEYLAQIESGELGHETAIQIATHIRNGEIVKVIPLLPEVKIDPNDPEEVKKQKELNQEEYKKRLEKVKTYALYGGGGLAAILAVMALFGMKSGNEGR